LVLALMRPQPMAGTLPRRHVMTTALGVTEGPAMLLVSDPRRSVAQELAFSTEHPDAADAGRCGAE